MARFMPITWNGFPSRWSRVRSPSPAPLIQQLTAIVILGGAILWCNLSPNRSRMTPAEYSTKPPPYAVSTPGVAARWPNARNVQNTYPALNGSIPSARQTSRINSSARSRSSPSQSSSRRSRMS